MEHFKPSIKTESINPDKSQEQLLLEKIPYIKFPKEWEIKLLPGSERAPIKFLIKKEGEPNEIGCSIDFDFDLHGEPHWDFVVLNSTDFGTFIPVKETDKFIEKIEEKFKEKFLDEETDVFEKEVDSFKEEE